MTRPTSPRGWSWIRHLASAWGLALVATLVCYLVWTRKIDVHAEEGPLEVVQLAGWCAALVVVLVALVRARNMRDRMSAIWLGAIAFMATFREMDLHEAASKGHTWLPPVHFRLDWLTDPSQPLGAKIFWVTFFALIGAALTAPLLMMKAPTLRLLRAGDAPTWLLFICFGMLGAGYVTDDILGRGRFGVHYEVTQGIEEVFELFGVLAFGFAVWHECRAPLSSRVAALMHKAPESISATGVDATRANAPIDAGPLTVK